MRCCASPTTCSVDSIGARRAGELFEALLLMPFVRAMLPGLDALGDFGAELFAETMAGSDRKGFAAAIAAQLERRS